MSEIKPDVEHLIIKYINKSATAKDLDALITCIDNPEHLNTFKSLVKHHYAITASTVNLDNSADRQRILQQIKKEKQLLLKKRFTAFYKYAAVVILSLSLGYVLTDYFTANPDTNSKEEKITLQLENGNTKIINEDGSSQIVDANGRIVGSQQGDQLTYTHSAKTDTLVYNTLKIPYGKRFNVTLSDGTKVHLNAGTVFKYPVKFINGLKREVFLIDGEAYFDVSEDKNHPFIANTQGVAIRVLGTKFNMSSYNEDSQINTVLVEGSVSIIKEGESYNAKTSTVLPIGHIGSWSKSNGKLQIMETDVEDHLAWIEGRLVLNEVPFKNILKKLERQYNVTFVNKNKTLDNRIFTARFDVEDINQVMNSLSEAANFLFRKNNSTIIINP